MLRSMTGLVALVLCLPALADETAIRKAVEARMPGAKVENIVQTPYAGLYEVQIGNEILYSNADASYLFIGSVHDGQTLENLTEMRLRQLSGIKFDELPFDQAFKIVNGNGARKMAYFTDPDCPYCRRMDEELTKVPDVTVHVFLYPILSPDSVSKSQSVWCSGNKTKAWQDLMLRSKAPTAKPTCDTPVLRNLQLGQKLRIRGTPALFFPSGQRVSGAITAPEVIQLLEQPAK